MCRRFRPNQDKEIEDKPDSLSPYDEHIDKFFNKVNNVSDQLAEATKRILSQTRDFSVSERESWRDMMNKEVEPFFNKPYQARSHYSDEDRDMIGLREVRDGRNDFESQFMRPFSFFNVFGDGGAETPFGLYSQNPPTTREYNTCLKKDGVSLWDSNGSWRCLFPNSAVPAKFLLLKNTRFAEKILTKEDFEKASRRAGISEDGSIDLGDKGIFFKQFEDLMKWKNTVYESEAMRREQRRKKYLESFPKRFNDFKNNSSLLEENNSPVSWSSDSTTTTDPETNQIVVTETKTEYFPDGTSLTNSVVKKKAIGAKLWETIEEESHRNEGKKGWFWN